MSGPHDAASWTPDQLAQARDWIDQCDWRENQHPDHDDIRADQLPDQDVVDAIARHWDGGVHAFLAD